MRCDENPWFCNIDQTDKLKINLYRLEISYIYIEAHQMFGLSTSINHID